MKNLIRIATRKSPLALQQAKLAESLLKNEGKIELIPMNSSGDTYTEKKFKDHGGKGLFLKELEESLLNKTADVAVHSLKDVPAVMSNKFEIATILSRENPLDVFVSNKYKTIKDLPKNALIGTSSPRRIAQIKNLYKDIGIVTIRGNIQTRMSKIKEGEIDGIILAAAGLHRMSLEGLIKEYLPLNIFTPSAGQGILCLQFLKKNDKIRKIINKYTLKEVEDCANIERQFIRKIGGNCMSPIGVNASIKNNKVNVTGFVSSIDGRRHIKSTVTNDITEAEGIGATFADVFIKQGAKKIIKET